MSRHAFVFPGQGSQTSGMGADLAGLEDSVARSYFREADDVLGFPLSRLCFEGTPEELLDTAVTQPAVFVTSLAFGAALRERGLTADVVAGHSLGEYTALVWAGVLDWQSALRLVRTRGELMAGVNTRTPGGMAAVLGLPSARVAELCARTARESGETVEIANYNSGRQTVVSGSGPGVAEFARRAAEAGAERVVPLRTGAPFHCSLMADIEDEFGAHLDAVDFGEPRVPVISNVTAQYVDSGARARELLRRQLAAPVRWQQTVELLAAEEVSALVEVGPGRVLTNLNRVIAPAVPAAAVGTVGRLTKAVDRFAPAAA
ncbi:ACP S-malonyltransferase [Streptomyces spectabilis]|uniref:Malonyl CoA-acyl carrier protein transacylase n=2 Tax=Streptomyces spectabilis TaxID=68270 RepID=A0A5P2WZE9_STRST|nr:ACP S-malonyltransferase [Streptomyces spectabilis]QEV57478.1 [acyl-carrier-protein] S-malonyltransferase [Streptomyces spectabilis]GGV42744.1 malonyl CoA-acyl carrier protein transacylase [Streptomyces spectabilis]